MVEPDGHKDALEEAWDALQGHDPKIVASNSGAVHKAGSKELQLDIMGECCIVDLQKRSITHCGRRTGSLSHHIQILVLHYLLGSANAQLANKPVTYRDFDGGALYYPAFKARTIDLVVKEFGQKPDILKHVADALHAEPLKMGSVGFKVNFFPKMPVTIILWLGDEEVSASANVLFDANAGRILPTEDLTVLGGSLVNKLISLAKA